MLINSSFYNPYISEARVKTRELARHTPDGVLPNAYSQTLRDIREKRDFYGDDSRWCRALKKLRSEGGTI